MSKRDYELSDEDEELVSRVFDLLQARLSADPYGWDGSFALEIRSLPTGLRSMAATHHLDISLTMDGIGWHFVNFGHPSHVEETERGLRELRLPEVAAMFQEAYQLLQPLLSEIRAPGGDYYAIIERAGVKKRINELSDSANTAVGKQGIHRHWAAYAKDYPELVFAT